jgi:hypothetical protein
VFLITGIAAQTLIFIMWERARMNWRTMTADDVQADELLGLGQRSTFFHGVEATFVFLSLIAISCGGL